MPIKTTNDRSNEFTEHVVTDTVTDEEMFKCQDEFLKNNPTKLELWDMSNADLDRITTEGVRQFISRAAHLGKTRQGGRTAVIVQSKLQYGLGRMAQAFGEFTSLPFSLRLFRIRVDAIAWLKTGSEYQPEINSDNL